MFIKGAWFSLSKILFLVNFVLRHTYNIVYCAITFAAEIHFSRNPCFCISTSKPRIFSQQVEIGKVEDFAFWSQLGWGKMNLFFFTGMFLIHSTYPQSWPVGIIVFAHVVRTYSNSSKTNIKRKPCSLLTWLLVRPSGSLMTPVLFSFFHESPGVKVSNLSDFGYAFFHQPLTVMKCGKSSILDGPKQDWNLCIFSYEELRKIHSRNKNIWTYPINCFSNLF